MIDLHNLPKDAPVLLNMNHPGGFIDAVVISGYSPRSHYYLTRGDFFKGGIVSWFLTTSHQIPIYRAQDGIKNLRNLSGTFSKCFEALSENKLIIIFPESLALPIKRLRHLHNGAARIMFGTHVAYPDLAAVIVPVGVTFTDANTFGRDAFFRFGKPISVARHMELYHDDPKKAFTLVMKEVEMALRSLMVILDTDEKEALFDDAIVILETPVPEWPAVSHSPDVYDWQISIANRVNTFEEEKLNTLNYHISEIKKILNEADLPYFIYPLLEDKYVGPLFMFFAAPFITIGKLIEAFPVWITHHLAVNKIKKEVFIGPVKSMFGFYVHALYYLIITIVLGLFLGWVGLGAGIVAALLGYFSLNQHRKPKFQQWMRWRKISGSKKDALSEHRRRVAEMLDIANTSSE